MRNRWIGILASLLFLSLSLSAHAKEPIGFVKFVEGVAYVQRGFERILCKPGLELFEDDLIRTRDDSRLGATLIDGTVMALSANTLIQIHSFIFDENGEIGELDTSVESGKLAIRTGRIGKQSRSDIKIRTDQSIMGVRGTFFAVAS